MKWRNNRERELLTLLPANNDNNKNDKSFNNNNNSNTNNNNNNQNNENIKKSVELPPVCDSKMINKNNLHDDKNTDDNNSNHNNTNNNNNNKQLYKDPNENVFSNTELKSNIKNLAQNNYKKESNQAIKRSVQYANGGALRSTGDINASISHAHHYHNSHLFYSKFNKSEDDKNGKNDKNTQLYKNPSEARIKLIIEDFRKGLHKTSSSCSDKEDAGYKVDGCRDSISYKDDCKESYAKLHTHTHDIARTANDNSLSFSRMSLPLTSKPSLIGPNPPTNQAKVFHSYPRLFMGKEEYRDNDGMSRSINGLKNCGDEKNDDDENYDDNGMMMILDEQHDVSDEEEEVDEDENIDVDCI